MSCRDRVETTCVAVALVAWEGELASSDGEPSRGVLLNVNNESDRARIAGSCSCGVHVFERASNRPRTRRTALPTAASFVSAPPARVPPGARGRFHASWSRSQSLAAPPPVRLHRAFQSKTAPPKLSSLSGSDLTRLAVSAAAEERAVCTNQGSTDVPETPAAVTESPGAADRSDVRVCGNA